MSFACTSTQLPLTEVSAQSSQRAHFEQGLDWKDAKARKQGKLNLEGQPAYIRSYWYAEVMNSLQEKVASDPVARKKTARTVAAKNPASAKKIDTTEQDE